MAPKELEPSLPDTALKLKTLEYAALPASAPPIIAANTIYVRAPDKIESVVDAERRRGFQGLVRRYMNQLLYGCQRDRCDTATCYTFRRTLSRNTNASRKLTVLSARIIACHLATQDDPFKALCPGKPVVPVMSSETEVKEGGTSRDSSFREEIHEDEDAEKENKEVVKTAVEAGERGKKRREGEVETVTDKGLKDPKSFPQQLFNTMSLKMVEWIGLPPLSGVLRFSPETSPPAAPKLPELNSPREPESPQSPHEQPPKYKFHSNPMELIDTGRLHRDSEPVSQHRHQEILQAPPPKRRASNPPPKVAVTPTPHSTAAAKAKMAAPGSWGMPLPPAPPPLNHTHSHSKPRPFIPHTPQTTPSRGEKRPPTSTASTNEPCVAPPQSLAKLDPDICKALATMCLSGTSADKCDAAKFARQSLFYVFSTPEALLKSFVAEDVPQGEMDLDMYAVDVALGDLAAMPGWGDMILRSLWRGLETAVSGQFDDREVARVLLVAVQVLAAMVPASTPEEWAATRKLRASGRVSESGVISEIGFAFENEMAEKLMRRVVKAVAYCVLYREGVVGWVKGYFKRCGCLQEEERRRETARDLGEELAKGLDRGRGGWGLGTCTLEWCRAVLLKSWDGQQSVKKNSIVASCLSLLKLLHADHKAYGLEPEYFHTPVLSDRFDSKEVPVEWFNALSDPKTAHFLDHPFLFPPHALVTYFRAINFSHMSKAYEQSMTMARLTSQMSMNTSLLNPHDETLIRGMRIALSTYLLVEVNRATVLEDALNQVFRRELRELQRPLKVRFANNGEEGVDHGGVQQEFFIIALREALRPEYGMFTTDERTRMSWFSVCPIEPVHKFELLGLLVGLAVYNGVTLPVTFPRVLYQKLLGGEPEGLGDIRDGWGELANGLSELLEWSEGDVGDVFLRTYDFAYEAFGKVKNVDMLKAKVNGMEFLEEVVVKPPWNKDRKKKKKKEEEEKKKESEPQVADLLDMGNWLAAPAPGERDPWLGGLNEVLEVLDREASPEPEREPTRARRYEVTYNVILGEEAWEDVEEGMLREAVDISVEDIVIGGRRGERAEAEAEAEAPMDAQAETETETEAEAQANDEKKEEADFEHVDESEDSDDDDGEIDADNAMQHVGGVRLFDIPPPLVGVSDDEEETQESQTQAEKEPESLPAEATEPDTAETTDKPEDSIPQVWEEPEEEAELVTNANREQYVKDYISWLTDRSVRRQYQAFEKGFLAVLDKKALSLFTPASLQNLVEGIQEIDIEGLEKTARYDDGYGPDHKTIRDFWTIVKTFTPERKKQLLEFVTASDRVPVNGIGSIMFVIQRNGPDTDRVPTSLTCFGRLLLPEYSSRKKLREKLKLALENGKGFGVP